MGYSDTIEKVAKEKAEDSLKETDKQEEIKTMAEMIGLQKEAKGEQEQEKLLELAKDYVLKNKVNDKLSEIINNIGIEENVAEIDEKDAEVIRRLLDLKFKAEAEKNKPEETKETDGKVKQVEQEKEEVIVYPFEDIVANVNEKAKGKFDNEKVEAAVANCAIVVLSSLGGIDVERMANFIIEKLEDAEDNEVEEIITLIEDIKVAGPGSAIVSIGDMIEKIREIRENNEPNKEKRILRDRVVSTEDISKVKVPKDGMIALMGTDHVIEIKDIKGDTIEYKELNEETKQIETKAKTIEEFNKNFSGILIVPANSANNEGLSKVTASMNDIYDALGGIEIKKLTGQEKQEIRKILNAIVNGVTKPQEIKDTVKAVLAIYSKADEMAQAIGFNNIEEITKVSKEEIIDKYTKQVLMIMKMEGLGGEDIQASIEILSVVKDMLIMVNNNNSLIEILNNPKTDYSDIMKDLVINKAVNQNVVTATIKDSITKVKEDYKEFEIDLSKLQKAVKEKKTITKGEIIKDLGAMLAGGRGAAKENMPIALMKLSNIHAIAASA